MARTNIEIDDGLVEKAMRLTGASTKREVVDIALYWCIIHGRQLPDGAYQHRDRRWTC